MPERSNPDSKLVMELVMAAYLQINGPKINVLHINQIISKVATIYLQLTKKLNYLATVALNCLFWTIYLFKTGTSYQKV
jgi:hypothetical protein